MRLLVAHIAILMTSVAVNASDADTTRTRTTKQWTLTSDYTREVPLSLDTAFSLFHRYRITDKNSDFIAYPGNYGQPLYQINFFDRTWDPDRFLVSHYLPFMHSPLKPLFVNTQRPFTELRWSFGGARSNAEQTFRIRHSQNVNRKLNFGLVYDIVYNIGQYNYQKAVNKDFLFHSSYNGIVYTAYFAAGVNNLSTRENGGVTDIENISPDFAPDEVPVNLNDLNKAETILRNRYIMFVQRFSPSGTRDTITGEKTVQGPVTFSHTAIYEWNKRRYFDSYPASGFYDTMMISKTATADSLFQGVLYNTLRVDIAAGRAGRFRIGAGGGVRSELYHFAQVIPGETLLQPDTLERNQSSLVLTGKIFNDIGDRLGWWASGDLWFQGYRAGDFRVNGRLFKEFTLRKGPVTWDVTGMMGSITPSYWACSWGSNNYSWTTEPDREFRIETGTSLSYPSRNLSLRFNYTIIDNFSYFDSLALPVRHSGGLSVAALSLRKEFTLWKLHWDNTILIQKSSNEDVLSLPLATGRSAFFFGHNFRFKSTGGELNTQLGGEVMIHTPYRAMGYMPATGRYFNQEGPETGYYPFVNVFLNIKLKRTRFFLMFDHVNSGMSGYEYFLVPGYPMNIRMFRYGLAWTFYD